MARRVADLYHRVRHLVPELAKFGIVGGIGAIVDLGGAAVLHSSYHQGPLTSKAISITVATLITYLGSRFWTFRHRENQPMLREGVLFFALNVVGLLIAEAVIGCTTYVLGFKDPIAYNIASLAGTGLGTIFRYFAYRKWVFLAPATQPAMQPVPAAATEYPPYSTWEAPRWDAPQWQSPGWEPLPYEPDPVPAYSGPPMHQPGQVMLPNSAIQNGAVAPHLVTASSSAWPASEPRPVARPVPSGPRTPGRHRKTR